VSTYVYKITNTANGKIYYGKAASVSGRWANHLTQAKQGKGFALHRALRKYGREVFKLEVVAVLDTNEEASALETQLIALVPPTRGYNIAKGGDGGLTLTPKQVEAQLGVKTGQHPALIEMYEAGRSLAEVARFFKTSRSSVGRSARKLGLSFNEKRKELTLQRKERARQVRIEASTKARFLEDLRDCHVVGVDLHFDRAPAGCLVDEPLAVTHRATSPLSPPGNKRDSAEYRSLRSEIAKKSNRLRGLGERQQREVLALYTEEHLTAKQVAEKLGVSVGAVRGVINRTYKALSPEVRKIFKSQHGHAVRSGPRNTNYGKFKSPT
jgi:group I intron endonuclease